jgi:hypothetical protein
LFFNSRKYITINVLTSDNKQDFANDEVLISKNIINYSLKPYWIQKRMADNPPKLLNIDSLIEKDTIVENLFFRKNFVQIGNVKMLILKYNNFDDFVADKKLKIDYLILTKNVYVKLSEFMQFIDFQKVIIASNNKIWRIKKWKQECEELGIPYHDVTTQGAWRIDFVSGREIMNRQ